ncbi:MAG: 4-hydroxybenzoate octaprenyltransferase [Hyphomicrobiaceae bacterium]|nr:4-hydroxybenzoate octaprenyltransferase [Hyphomicrobiaceae bacterium]
MTQHAKTKSTPGRMVADAVPGNWVDRLAPESWRPYLRLARADRPIGVWLLLWPCWWSLALAAVLTGQDYPSLWYMMLFAIGSIVMRGAGCAWNDIVDRDFDSRVARTRSRPIPSGQITLRQAQIFMCVLALIGLVVLLQFNWFTVLLGFASLLPVAIYPFMKRFTYWPQVVLGFAFNWGALMGWAAEQASLSLAPLLLYGGAVAWTIGYDTIYAHQDKEDDALLGLKSTALKFGERTKPWLALFYTVAFAAILAAGITAGAGVPFLLIMAAGAVHLCWQTLTLDVSSEKNCLSRFRANRDFGAIVFAALIADMVMG